MIALALGCGWLVGRWASRPDGATQRINTSTIIRQVQSLSELVTVKYVMEKVVIVEDVKWYGEERLLLLAHGVVKAGIDLSELKEENIKQHGTTVSIKLPMEKITDAYLDEKQTGVIERSTGLVRTFNKDLEANARRQAADDIRRAARQAGILQDARQRAELELKVLLTQLGFTEVKFESPYNE